MKALVVQYGHNLERLKDETGADVLDLILRQHKICIQGRREAYEKLIYYIDSKAEEVFALLLSSVVFFIFSGLLTSSLE